MPVVAILALGSITIFCAGDPSSSEPEKPNIILLIVDALRPDHLGCYGYERPTSPTIDRLAAEGIVFETAITQAPWTKASFPSMLTSLYPFQHGVTTWESVLPETIETLPEVLVRHGYQTACVVHMVGLEGRFRILKGFQQEITTVKTRRGAARTSEVAIQAMKSLERPFFVMVHYMDTHKPYRMPQAYVDLMQGDSDIEPFRWRERDYLGTYERPSDHQVQGEILLYDAGIRSADDGIGQILDYLEEAGLRENTVIAVTADHGESFWEHRLPLHTTNVYDEAIKVPLIFTYPALLREPRRVRDQVRLIDLFPTLVDFSGAAIPKQCEGASLVGLMETLDRQRGAEKFLPESVALCECTTLRAPATRCIRDGAWKIIVESLTSGIELYDLRQDPGETENVWGTGRVVEDSLLHLIEKVPGVRLGGWRLAFTGVDTLTRFNARLSLPGGGRFSRIVTLTKPAEVMLETEEDSSGFSAETIGRGVHILLFNTDPQGVPVRLDVAHLGDKAEPQVYAGLSTQRPVGRAFDLQPDENPGPPGYFEIFRRSGAPGVHIWWFSGQELGMPGPTSTLTPEETKRLKSLGYIH